VVVEHRSMDHIGNGGGTALGLLADLPGRDLQTALAAIDPHALSGRDLALVIRAQARLLAWIQASMAATITDFVHCPASSECRQHGSRVCRSSPATNWRCCCTWRR